MGTRFVLRTDHASLQWLFRQNNDGMIFRILQKLQEFDFQVVHRLGEKHGNAYGLSRQGSQTPELTEEEKEEKFGDCSPAENLSDALGHIQMVISWESYPGASTDIKLTHAPAPKIQMAKPLTFTRHEFEDETTERIETDTNSDLGPQNTDCDSELPHQIKTQTAGQRKWRRIWNSLQYELPEAQWCCHERTGIQRKIWTRLVNRRGEWLLQPNRGWWDSDDHKTVDFNKPDREVPKTDDGSNYCSHNNFGRVRMTSNPDQSSKHEANFPNNDKTSMEIVLE